MKYLLNLFLLLVIFVPCKAQHLKPSLNLKKGGTYYITGSSNSSILQTINGKENQVNVGLAYRMAFKVTGIVDSGYNMEVRYQTLHMKIKVANNAIEMDSKKNDKEDVPSTIIATMMNKPFMIVMSKSGRIKSIKNVEQMITGVFDSFPQDDAVKKEQIKKQLLQSFGGSAFKGNLEMQTAIKRKC